MLDLSLVILSFTSCSKPDVAISRLTMRVSSSPFIIFSFNPFANLGSCAESRIFHAELLEEKKAPRIGRYFHPNAWQFGYISLCLRLSAP